MKITLKRVWIPAACFLAIAFIAVNIAFNASHKSNALEGKIIGSHFSPMFDSFDLEVETLPEFASFADKIIIGKIENIAEVREAKMHYDDENAASYIETYYNVHVDKTLLGDSSDEIKICLLGEPDNNNGITKPKIGEDLVLFLSQNQDGSFAIVGFERGIFRVLPDKTVESFSDAKVTAQYDGTSIDFLVKNILASIKK